MTLRAGWLFEPRLAPCPDRTGDSSQIAMAARATRIGSRWPHAFDGAAVATCGIARVAVVTVRLARDGRMLLMHGQRHRRDAGTARCAERVVFVAARAEHGPASHQVRSLAPVVQGQDVALNRTGV